MAQTTTKSLLIDDRSSGTLLSTLGTKWRLVTDQVMGGISSGTLKVNTYKNQDCLHLQGHYLK